MMKHDWRQPRSGHARTCNDGTRTLCVVLTGLASVLLLAIQGSLAQQVTLVSFETPSSRGASLASLANNAPNARDATTQQTLSTQSTNSELSAHSSALPKLDTSFGRLPLSFERNDGQTDAQVQFLARGRGYTLFLTPGEAVLALRGRENVNRESFNVNRQGLPQESAPHASRLTPDKKHETAVVRMKLEGANTDAQISGMEKLPGIVNYFIGSDPKKWRTNIPTYQKVEYKNVYPGIDLAYYGHQGKLEYDLIVGPGADPSQIKLAFEGADKIELDPATGDLVLTLPQSSPLTPHASPLTVHLQKPLVYQLDDNGHKQLVAGTYVVLAGSPHASRLAPHEVGLQLASYDTGRPLVIDPILNWSTYLGGNSSDRVNSIAVDGAGDAYLAGVTASTNFPGTAGSPIQSAHAPGGAFDAFVTKMNGAGTALIYSTYLGGSGSVNVTVDDNATSLAVDAAGNAYITGDTASTDFPGTTGSSIQSTHAPDGGTFDAFVTKINAAGTALVYSTYLGGTGTVIGADFGNGIAVDTAGNAYVIGTTGSNNFPGTAGSLIQPIFGGVQDAFVTKINAAGTAIVYSTYLGGSTTDDGQGIAVDLAGNAYVTGGAGSNGFPGTAGSLIQSTRAGAPNIPDAFVTKINPTGTALVYSTYLGGSLVDGGRSIAVDTAGNAYVTGSTTSNNFPTANALDPTCGTDGTCVGGAQGDAFVTKINAAGTALVYSTYLGGTSTDNGWAIAVDAAANAVVVGFTSATDFPMVNALDSTCGTDGACNSGQQDAFVAKLNNTATALVFSTYLGGSSTDQGSGVALDAGGNTYVTGGTSSTDFTIVSPFTTPAPGGGTIQGGDDAFVAKICNDPPPGTTPGTWAATASLTTARGGHTATRLSNGKVLIAGGHSGSSPPLDSSELYDPQAGTWTPTGSLTTARSFHTATLLANGKVLAAGGGGGQTSAELYDPTAGTWTATGSMTGSGHQGGHTATLLPDGKVLVAGGIAGMTVAELYDPITATWTSTGSLTTGRRQHTATLLPNGTVLIVGGLDIGDVTLASSEVYDPQTGTWTATGSLSTARVAHTATLLPNGKVLVVGGQDFASLATTASTELYDYQVGTWTSTGSLASGRAAHTATLLSNGKVIVAAGFSNTFVDVGSTAELYDTTAGTWGSTGSLTTVHPVFTQHTQTLLPNGTVLLVGGDVGPTSLASAELYTPALCAAAAPFTLAPTPASRTIVQGQSTTYTIALTAQNGFSSPVTLSVTSGLPAGASADFVPNAVTPPGSATLVVSTSGATPATTSTLTIQGTSGSQTHSTSVGLTVTAPSGGPAALALTPTLTTVPGGSQVTFEATGGSGSYSFSFVTNQSGATLNASTGLYTAGGTAGTDTVQVNDGVTTAQAIVTVTAAAGAVDVSLDGRALAALGPAQTFNVEASSGNTFLVGLTTDRVHDLKLPPGSYTLSAGAGSLPFTITAACAVTLP